MSWRDTIVTYANRRGREIHRSPLGLGVEFGDGCAAFWMLPGEALSTVPISAGGPVDPSALIERYELLDYRRDRVLHVLRHHLRHHRLKVQCNRSGQWTWETQGGASSVIDVGDILTVYASEHEEIHAIVQACLQGQWIMGKAPSQRRVERYLSEPQRPKLPRPRTPLRSRRPRARHRLLEWARTTSRVAPPSADELKQALARGWRDVAAALATNPHLLPGLLTWQRRSDQFDEPGALLASEFFLVWSRLDPSPFLARLLATAHQTDLVELASQAAHAAVERNPKVRGALASSISAYQAWRDQLDDALAIAWLRCRSAM